MNAGALSAQAGLLALEAARIAGLIIVSPLPWGYAPMRARGAFALMLVLVVHSGSIAGSSALDSLASTAALVPGELLVGAAMGFVVRLAVAAVEIAGDLISPMIGLGAASLLDPHTQSLESPLTRMLRMYGLLLALLLGIHRVLIAALIASFRVLPPGFRFDPSRAVGSLTEISASTIAAGVRLALPVVAVLLVSQIALAFVSRAAPQMQIFSIGFAITLVVGAVTIFVSLPDFAHEVAVEFSRVGSRIERVATAMAVE